MLIFLIGNMANLSGQSPKPHSPVKPVKKEAKHFEYSTKIDLIIQKDLKKNSAKLNPPLSDTAFLKRIYLDTIGRIPTYEESLSFLDNKSPNKRRSLIDKLLDSEGYVSHQYTFWADLLRITTTGNINTGGDAYYYAKWIKEAIRSNMPYDKIVKSMLLAEGYPWENGATGYYLRDPGMELDNASNTIQAFLGTQLVCAQCHDHPFEKWTQEEYYGMASHTYGVNSRMPIKENQKLNSTRKILQQTTNLKKNSSLKGTVSNFTRPLSYGVNRTNKKLPKPTDYATNNKKKKDFVVPHTIFGKNTHTTQDDKDTRVESYSRWLTSKENPLFAKVIANRIWAKFFGIGIIKEVDDIREDTKPSNTELLNYITRLMKDNDFDLKTFQRILLNTKVYQRKSTTNEQDHTKPYLFTGPILRRMTAEQIWDSCLTMVVPNLDNRQGLHFTRAHPSQKTLSIVEGLPPNELAEKFIAINKAESKYYTKRKYIRSELLLLDKEQDIEKIKALRKQEKNAKKEMQVTIYGEQSKQKYYKDKKGEWKGLGNNLVRASESPSPMYPGNFIEVFGQSDRKIIDNNSKKANVNQILMRLNGHMFNQIIYAKTGLGGKMRTIQDLNELLDTLFLGVLVRKPTEAERKKLLPLLKENRGKSQFDIFWALLNTNQFIFIS